MRTLDDEGVECKEKIQIIETTRDEQVNVTAKICIFKKSQINK